MPETPETASEIQVIRYRLEAIEATQMLLVRDRSDSLLAEFIALFEKFPELKDLYCLIDGKRTQADLIAEMNKIGHRLSQPTISRRMMVLSEHDLINLVYVNSNGHVYEKNRVVERVLRLSKRLK